MSLRPRPPPLAPEGASSEDVSVDAARDRERILDALAEPVVLLSATRRIAFMNQAAKEAFGHDLAGRNVARAVRHPDALDALEAVMHGARRAGATVSVGQPATTYRVVVVALDADDVRPTHDRPVAAMSFTDVSHVIRAEAMRSDFVANVTHELRSPLTALSGFIETLKHAARDDADARARFLEIMEAEAQRMDRLIDDLLSLSKVEAEEQVRPREPIDVLSTVAHVVAVLTPKACARDQALVLDHDVADARVAADRDQIGQVFVNLIDNALKYSAPGTDVTISLARERRSGLAGEAVRIDVRDRGEGIAPEHLPRLTERFYRVDAGRSRAMGGTGLGLAIVKHIVNRHRGRLAVESRQGEGTCVTVWLPVFSHAHDD